MQRQRIKTERGVFHAITMGDEKNPVLLCLHGFPDNCETYSDLLHSLSRQGFFCIAPNLRGYAPSPIIGPYRTEDLADDVLALATVLSPESPIYVVGHDIGGQLLYRAMVKAPSRFLSAVILAAPHPQAIMRNSRTSLRQFWRSRYILLMQIKGVAEWWLSRKNFLYVERLWREWSPEFPFPEDHFRSIKETIKASMPAPVEMYRSGDFAGSREKLMTPTLLLVGDRDGCVSAAMASGQEALFTGQYELRIIPNTGHFLHREAPEVVTDYIRNWFNSSLHVSPITRTSED